MEKIIQGIEKFIKKHYRLTIVIIFTITITLAFVYQDFLKKWQDLLGALITGIIAIAVVFVQKQIDRQRIKEEYRPLLIVTNIETNVPKGADYTCDEDLYYYKLKNGELPLAVKFIRIRNVSKNRAILMYVKIKYSENHYECSYFEVLESDKEIFIMQSQENIKNCINQSEKLKKEALQKSNFNNDRAIKRIQCQQYFEKDKVKEKPESIKRIDIYLTSEQNEKLHYVFLPQKDNWNTDGTERKNAFYFKLDDVSIQDYEFKIAPSNIYKRSE